MENEDDSWKLISLDERRPHALAPLFLQKVVRSPYFNTVFMVIILIDAIVAASRISRSQRDSSIPTLDERYYAQVNYSGYRSVSILNAYTDIKFSDSYI